ncbi:MFS transporter [Oryzifoliimicrobium ureilyticus]|uniref:MFS transporter n=1 Tax=Oryzifoliimicrobium ureilyticus TaxID=3113724 RepID=UPI003076710B
MPLALLVLSLSAFAIGTTEFVIMGLLPEVAADLGVTIPDAGWLVTGYALAVAFGAPLMAIATAKLPRRAALILLMAFFIAGNLLCAFAANYWLLLVARIVTALCHGAFFGIGSIVAASLVSPDRRARAVALMFTGLTLANVLGVPLGTAIGQAYGWRSTFAVVTGIGVITIVGLIMALPRDKSEATKSILQEVAALGNRHLWLALSNTVFFAASMFAMFTYIAPLLRDVTGVSPQGVTWTLFLIGTGLTVGNLIGGKFADWKLGASLTTIFALVAVLSTVFVLTSHYFIAAEITLFLWAAATFAAVPALQVGVVRFGKEAPNLVSTVNIGAFNVGNAVGAWAGGMVLQAGADISLVPLAAALLAVIGLGLTGATYFSAGGRKLAAAE